MDVVQIIQIVVYCITFLAGVVCSIIGFVRAAKAKKAATTAEEAEEANKLMEEKAKELIAQAETFFSSLDAVLKSTEGTTAGVYKKESVMAQLQTYCTSIGQTFDAEYWSKKIDDIVALTKQVNVSTTNNQ